MSNQPQLLINAKFLCQQISGVQRFGIEVSKELRKIYPNVLFLSPKNIKHHDLKEELNPICFGFMFNHLWEQIELPLFIKRNYPNSLLLNFCNTAPYFFSKQIVTVHDVSYLVNKKWFSFAFRTWYSFLIPSLVQKSLSVFTVSNFSKMEILRILQPTNPQKIHVVYNSSANIFKQEAIEKKGNYVLSVASLDPRKNLHRLIEAFRSIKEDFPGLKLILAGSPHKAFAEEAKKIMENSGESIQFTGYIDDTKLAELYRNARLFVYISLYEGFGIPPLEALSSGCPVLISDIPCHRECYPFQATFCDPLDPKDISFYMRNMLSTSPSLKELEGFQETTRVYSWQKSAESICNVVDNYLKK